MNPDSGSESSALSTVLVAASMRGDQWRQLNATARAWAAQGASASAASDARGKATALLDRIMRIEHCWAYPGRRLLARSRARRLPAATRRVRATGAEGLRLPSCRATTAATSRSGTRSAKATTRDARRAAAGHRRRCTDKPYFEVLVVTPTDPAAVGAVARRDARMRRADDAFNYEVVQVGSFEDALLAMMVNDNLQAVVIVDGFEFRSRHDMPDLQRVPRAPHQGRAPTTSTPGALATALARGIKRYRPELDLYLLTDRAPEALAGSDEAAPIRRIFHDVEELMELHLAILDGINDRYETPYFDNLKKYAQRPIGTFHALPIARGKSVFRSNWIRDMGQFYGTNILFAESSATTGGLDSLLEPTGNIKKAQEAVARAFGAKRAYFGTNGTSTSNKIVVQAVCKPGDIVIVDRNCHKSHHYGFVLSGAQPYYVEAFPLTQYSMYGAVPLRTIKKALLDCMAEGTLDRVKVIDLTNCTFDGHMYNPRRVMEECLAIKPDLIFLWDEAWFGFARFNPFHRRRTAMGAAAALTERYRSQAYRDEYEAWAKKHPKLDPKRPGAARHARCCPIRTRCASASTRPTRRTSRCRRSGRAR